MDIRRDIKDFKLRQNQSSNKQTKSILVTGLPRSGTTWFGAMLNTENNFVFHEPFISKVNLWNRSMNSEHLDELYGLFQKIQELRDLGRLISKEDNKLLRYTFFHRFLKKGNIIIKDPGLCYGPSAQLIDKFDDIVIIDRSSESIIASVYKNKWDPTGRLAKILCDNRAMTILPKRLINELNNFRSLDLLEKITLQTIILKFLMRHSYKNGIWVKYEEFAKEPIMRFQDLYGLLNLEYNNNIQKKHIELCFSDRETYARHDVARQSNQFVDISTRYMSNLELKRVRKYLEKFKVAN